MRRASARSIKVIESPCTFYGFHDSDFAESTNALGLMIVSAILLTTTYAASYLIHSNSCMQTLRLFSWLLLS
jgi:hypothetical protein